MYNPDGVDLTALPLPIEGDFDAIWMFSVVTHLAPGDTGALLAKLRNHIRPAGKLLFSAFIDDGLDGFDDRAEHALENAYYGKAFMESLVARAGWQVDAAYPHDPAHFIMDHFVCSPARTSPR